jgi:hypothetical protein
VTVESAGWSDRAARGRESLVDETADEDKDVDVDEREG